MSQVGGRPGPYSARAGSHWQGMAKPRGLALFLLAYLVVVCWGSLPPILPPQVPSAYPVSPDAPLQGLKRLQALAQQDPQSFTAHLLLANEYLKLDRLGEAAAEFGRVLELEPTSVNALWGLAGIAVKTHRSCQALELARVAAELQPHNPEVLNLLAIILVQTGEAEEAACILDRALQIRPDDPQLLANAARLAVCCGQPGKAERYLRRALASNPGSLELATELGGIFLQEGRLDEAVAQLQQMARSHPNAANVYEALGSAFEAQGQYSQALVAWQEGCRLQPDRASLPAKMGRVYLRLNQMGQALACFGRSVALAPGYLPAQLGRVMALEALGRIDQAIDVLQQLIRYYPDDHDLHNALAYLYAQKGEQLTTALRLAQRAVRAQPELAAYRDTLGWVCLKLGRVGEAIPHLQEAVRREPDCALSHYHLAQALAAGNRHLDAARELRTALALGLPSAEHREAAAALGLPKQVLAMSTAGSAPHRAHASSEDRAVRRDPAQAEEGTP